MEHSLPVKAYRPLAALAGLDMRQLDEHEQSAGALDLGSLGAGITLSLDEATLPVAGKLPGLHLRRAHMNAEDVRNLAAHVVAFAA